MARARMRAAERFDVERKQAGLAQGAAGVRGWVPEVCWVFA